MKYKDQSLQTKEILKNNFIDLLKFNNIEKITIKNLCDISDVSRGTFYFHFEDIYDLLNYAYDDIFSDLDDILDKYIFKEYYNKDVLLILFNTLAKKKDLYKNLNFNETELIKEKMMLFVKTKIFRIFESEYEHYEIKELDNYYPYIVSISSVIINQWLKDNMNISSNKIASLLKNVISSIIREMKK